MRQGSCSRAWAALLLAGLLGGCAAQVATRQSIIVASERSAVAQCENLAQIQTQSGWGGLGATGMGYNDALDQLKARAGERGATHVLLVNVSNTVGGTNMIGDAYRCR